MDSDSAARPPTRIMIVGAAGRMGQSLARLAAENDLLTVSALINRKDDYVGALKNTDVVIEFAKAEVTVPLARACAEAAVPIEETRLGFHAEFLCRSERALSFSPPRVSNFGPRL
jgi:dihydrodipicolinate reductase